MVTTITKPTDLPIAQFIESTAKHDRVNPNRLCPSAKERTAQLAINLIHGKWKMEILCELQHGPIRLSRLRKALPEASRKMLTQQLREMEKDDLILRTDLSSRLRHVEYSLSESHGVAILQLIDMLAACGTKYRSRENSAIPEANGRP
jgi:DNA-binding HxlR family transcriptional regulator